VHASSRLSPAPARLQRPNGSLTRTLQL
jgi:hypothetical protein